MKLLDAVDGGKRHALRLGFRHFWVYQQRMPLHGLHWMYSFDSDDPAYDCALRLIRFEWNGRGWDRHEC